MTVPPNPSTESSTSMAPSSSAAESTPPSMSLATLRDRGAVYRSVVAPVEASSSVSACEIHVDWQTNWRTREVRCGQCHEVFARECPAPVNRMGPPSHSGCVTCDGVGLVRL